MKRISAAMAALFLLLGVSPAQQAEPILFVMKGGVVYKDAITKGQSH